MASFRNTAERDDCGDKGQVRLTTNPWSKVRTSTKILFCHLQRDKEPTGLPVNWITGEPLNCLLYVQRPANNRTVIVVLILTFISGCFLLTFLLVPEWANEGYIYRTFAMFPTVKRKKVHMNSNSTWGSVVFNISVVPWLKIENITHQIFRFHGVSDTVKYERIQIGLNKLENDLYRIKLVMDENVISKYEMRKTCFSAVTI